MIRFEVNQQSGRKIPAAAWRRCLKKIERNLKIAKAEVSIALVGPAEIRKLNRLYRKLDKVTDVLSFGRPARAKKLNLEPADYLGEIIICLPQAQKQAKIAGHSCNAELELLLVHGFLHLLGYDHEKSATEARKMLALQEKITKTK